MSSNGFSLILSSSQDRLDIIQQFEDLPDIVPPISHAEASTLHTSERSLPYRRRSKQTKCTFDNTLLLSNLDMTKKLYQEKAILSRKHNSLSLDATYNELISILERATVLHRRTIDQLAVLERAEAKRKIEEMEKDFRESIMASEKRKIETEIREEVRKELETCIICCLEKQQVTAIPCGHCFCLGCFNKMKGKCGFCREKFSGYTTIRFTT